MIITLTVGDGTSNFVPKEINICVLALKYSTYKDGRVGISVGDTVYLINESEEQVLEKFNAEMKSYCSWIKSNGPSPVLPFGSSLPGRGSNRI